MGRLLLLSLSLALAAADASADSPRDSASVRTPKAVMTEKPGTRGYRFNDANGDGINDVGQRGKLEQTTSTRQDSSGVGSLNGTSDETKAAQDTGTDAAGKPTTEVAPQRQGRMDRFIDRDGDGICDGRWTCDPTRRFRGTPNDARQGRGTGRGRSGTGKDR